MAENSVQTVLLIDQKNPGRAVAACRLLLRCPVFRGTSARTHAAKLFFSISGNPAQGNPSGEYSDPGDRENDPHEHLLT